MSSLLKRHRILVLAVALFFCYQPLRAQIPDKFTNLKVLDQKIEKTQLMETMKGMSIGLGVRCVFCHEGDDNGSFDSIDFASDAKQTKKTAREMLKMTAAINNTYLANMASAHDNPVQVRCVTCHRGQSRPLLIQDVLDQALAAGGVDSAKTAYLGLKDRYYGSDTYDFSEQTLLLYASDLTHSNQPHAFEEIAVLALEMVMAPTGDPTEADFHGRVEQQRQVGRETPLDFGSQAAQEPGRGPSPPALVGQGRIREAIAYDPGSRLERRPDSGVQMLRTGREHEQGLDIGGQCAMVAIQYPAPNLLTELGAARLPRQQQIDAAGSQMAFDGREARRFADAFGPFDRDECAAPHWAAR